MRQHLGKVAAGLVGGALVILGICTACGGKPNGPSVADVASQRSSAQPAATASHSAVAYAQCMRAHGLPNFPDPGTNGAITLTGGPDSGLNPDSAQFKAAQQACASLQPNSGPAAPQTGRDAAVKYAKCMRDNGVTKFPDPDPQGGINFDPGAVDQNSAQFKAAQQACAKYQPGGPGAAQATAQAGG